MIEAGCRVTKALICIYHPSLYTSLLYFIIFFLLYSSLYGHQYCSRSVAVCWRLLEVPTIALEEILLQYDYNISPTLLTRLRSHQRRSLTQTRLSELNTKQDGDSTTHQRTLIQGHLTYYGVNNIPLFLWVIVVVVGYSGSCCVVVYALHVHVVVPKHSHSNHLTVISTITINRI